MMFFFACDLLIASKYFIDNENLLNGFLNHFENTWIGKKRRHGYRSEPKFYIELWNCYNDVIHDFPRTNNAEEGWNRAFAERLRIHHAKMSDFINCLKSEQDMTEQYIYEANGGRNIAIAWRKNYKDYDTKLKNVVSGYNRESVLEYLKALSLVVVLYK